MEEDSDENIESDPYVRKEVVSELEDDDSMKEPDINFVKPGKKVKKAEKKIPEGVFYGNGPAPKPLIKAAEAYSKEIPIMEKKK